MHNLFGDTNAVHVRLSDEGEAILDAVVKGDTVREVLNYVQFSAENLITKLRRDVETAVREGRMGYEESGQLLRFYEEGLQGYTYLEEAHVR
jgi:arginine decarboxylase